MIALVEKHDWTLASVKWSMTYSGEYYDWTLASVKLDNLSGLML